MIIQRKEEPLMKRETREYLIKESKALLDVSFACPEAKAVCKDFLAKAGTNEEDEAALSMIDELKEDVEKIDDLLAFASSSHCEKAFGEEEAKNFLKRAEELKKSGAKYCDCPACTAALEIISKEKEIKD
jgi:ornithine carbamoyltransferase